MQYFVGFVYPRSAEANNGCGRKSDGHLMANCVRNICIKHIKVW